MSVRSIINRLGAAWARRATGSGTTARRVSRMAWLGVLALLAGSLLNLVVAPGISAAAEATASVTPAVGGPSMRFTFTASGFKGDLDNKDDEKSNDAEKVAFWINTPDGKTIRAAASDSRSYMRASRAGTVTWTWQAPSDALPGAYTLVAHGITTGHEAVIPFTVEGSARGTLIVADQSATPSAGTAGTKFTFALGGFIGDVDDGKDDQTNNAEDVSFWINLPNGQVIPAKRVGVDKDDSRSSVVQASRAGAVQLTWQAPANALPGTYTLVAHGNQSDREQVIAFEIL